MSNIKTDRQTSISNNSKQSSDTYQLLSPWTMGFFYMYMEGVHRSTTLEPYTDNRPRINAH